MGEIAKDIRVAARGYVGHSHRWIGPDEVTTLIARAILAERERCGKIAKRVWRDADFYENAAIRRAVSLIRCRIETGAPQ